MSETFKDVVSKVWDTVKNNVQSYTSEHTTSFLLYGGLQFIGFPLISPNLIPRPIPYPSSPFPRPPSWRDIADKISNRLPFPSIFNKDRLQKWAERFKWVKKIEDFLDKHEVLKESLKGGASIFAYYVLVSTLFTLDFKVRLDGLVDDDTGLLTADGFETMYKTLLTVITLSAILDSVGLSESAGELAESLLENLLDTMVTPAFETFYRIFRGSEPLDSDELRDVLAVGSTQDPYLTGLLAVNSGLDNLGAVAEVHTGLLENLESMFYRYADEVRKLYTIYNRPIEAILDVQTTLVRDIVEDIHDRLTYVGDYLANELQLLDLFKRDVERAIHTVLTNPSSQQVSLAMATIDYYYDNIDEILQTIETKLVEPFMNDMVSDVQKYVNGYTVNSTQVPSLSDKIRPILDKRWELVKSVILDDLISTVEDAVETVKTVVYNTWQVIKTLRKFGQSQ